MCVAGYAAALRGLLLLAGSRLSPPVLSKLGRLLAAMLPNVGESQSASCRAQLLRC